MRRIRIALQHFGTIAEPTATPILLHWVIGQDEFGYLPLLVCRIYP
jgi:hypothetical protein